MSKLQISVLLAAVDKITSPLKAIRNASTVAARQVKETQDQIKGLSQQAGQIDSFRKLKQSLASTSGDLAKAQKEVQRLALEMGKSEAPSKALVRDFERARNAASKLKDKQKELAASHHQQRSALRSAGIDTRNLSQHQRRLTADMARANSQLAEQRRRLQQINEQQKKLAAAHASYQKTKAAQGKMAGAGATVAAVSSASLYAGAQFLSPGLDFTAAQSKVQALTRLDKNDSQAKALSKQARHLGATTSFTANDVSQGQAFLAMAGFDAKSIQEAMPSMLNLAKANDTDLATTSDIASNILSGFGLKADQMTRLSDVMTATTTRSNVNLVMLGETMKYVAPVARDLGVSIEDAAAMAGLLGNVGIQASQGGTVMRGMLNRLAGQTPKAAKAIEKLGLKTKDAAGNLRAIPDILADAARATQKMGTADRAAILKTIFGVEAGTGVSELIKQQGESAISAFSSILKKSAGENAKVAKTMADNAKGDIETLKSGWEDLGIELFEGNSAGIRSFIQQITGVVNAVGNWMKANPELTATLFKLAAGLAVVAAVGGTITLMLAGILGPLAMLKLGASVLGIQLPLVGAAFAKLGGVFTWIIGGLRALSMALLTTPIGWVILGITALIAVGYLLIKNWSAIKVWASDLWQTIKTKFATGFEDIKSFFSSLPEQFASFGTMIMDGLVNGITSKLASVKETITGVASDSIGWFKSVLGIASPSKVFATMGDQTMQGLDKGLNRSKQSPLSQVAKLGKQMAGTALAVGIATTPVAAGGLTPAAQSTPVSSSISAPITIYASPNQSASEIARMVAMELDKREKAQSARMRSSFKDLS